MDILKPENVQICQNAASWQDAIRISTKPLEERGYVEKRYKEAIVDAVNRLGPYILVTDHVALPHARPEEGAIQTQIAVTLFREPVAFPGGSEAQLFVTLAAADNNSHLDALMEVSERLSEEADVRKALACPDEKALYQFFN